MNTPRLLDEHATAAFMGMSASTFRRRRHALECIGFPLPCLDADDYGGRRWDRAAVESWLDHRIPAHLRGNVKQAARTMRSPADIAATLEQRAKEIVQ